MSTVSPPQQQQQQQRIAIVESSTEEESVRRATTDENTADAATESTTSSTSSAVATPGASPDDDLSAPFRVLPSRFAKDENSALRAYYTKWDLASNCVMAKLRYLAAVNFADAAATHAFIVDLFNSPALRSVLTPYDAATRRLQPMNSTDRVESVSFKPVKTSCVDLHLFDRIWDSDAGIVYGSVDDPIPELRVSSESDSFGASSGTLRKCFEDVINGVTITDELRKMVIDRDSDNYELYSSADRSELLFQLLTHLLVGGGLNQYENSIHPYLGAVKLLYKDLLSVRTNRNTRALEIANLVFRVDGVSVRGVDEKATRPLPLFGKKSNDPHHLCLLSIDPQKKHVMLYYFAHTEAW